MGQNRFRKRVFSLWGNTCAITGLSNSNLLIASHIKPFSECQPHETENPYNGILLSPNWDSLLDNGFISFENDGTIKISRQLSEKDAHILSVDKNIKIHFDNSQKDYLDYHRHNVFRG
jgi:predicted restriction endonuclease